MHVKNDKYYISFTSVYMKAWDAFVLKHPSQEELIPPSLDVHWNDDATHMTLPGHCGYKMMEYSSGLVVMKDNELVVPSISIVHAYPNAFYTLINRNCNGKIPPNSLEFLIFYDFYHEFMHYLKFHSTYMDFYRLRDFDAALEQYCKRYDEVTKSGQTELSKMNLKDEIENDTKVIQDLKDILGTLLENPEISMIFRIKELEMQIDILTRKDGNHVEEIDKLDDEIVALYGQLENEGVSIKNINFVR